MSYECGCSTLLPHFTAAYPGLRQLNGNYDAVILHAATFHLLYLNSLSIQTEF